MVDVPRRLTLSGADKVAIIADRAAPGSHRGNTNWSKPSAAKTPTMRTPVPGSPVADVTYRDPNTSLAFGSGLANTTDFVFGDGNPSEWFAYRSISVGAGGVSLLQAGWFQVECRSGGGANAAGDVVRITAHLAIGNVIALDIADSSTNIAPRVLTLPFYYDGTYDFIVGVDVDGPAGGSAYRPTISVVAFGP